MTSPSQSRPSLPQPATRSGVGSLVVLSRWLQLPLYVGLIVAQVGYLAVFVLELIRVVQSVVTDGLAVDVDAVTLGALGLVSIVLVSSLLVVLVIGGYETFVSRSRVDTTPERSEWLPRAAVNGLAPRVATLIILISLVHLLKTFLQVGALGATAGSGGSAPALTSEGVFWQVMIQLVFVVAAVALVVIARIAPQEATAQTSASTEPEQPQLLAEAAPQHLASDEQRAINTSRADHYERIADELRGLEDPAFLPSQATGVSAQSVDRAGRLDSSV